MWHNQGVSRGEGGSRERERGRRAPQPLDPAKLQELALRYVSRFATTRAKAEDYLRRKLRERGWNGEGSPDPDGLVSKLAALGYIDDAAFARAKAGSLGARGYGLRRVSQALAQAGVSEADGEDARTVAGDGAVEAAVLFARRRRIGPFATGPGDPAAREKALAAMIRAGHGFALAKAIVNTAPGEQLDLDDFGPH
ncbi:MAG: Regulatory protein RecX [uncultured Sphingomonas sp.]|uniref:Regulatory protein RecX n=1 Tax=uncultured Sphingomonas sp. TaxID=158754 RepID=A0A6J4SQ14_9SPHN|nr:MAG: Regulatory protein RecX [uncultured Sphingomonas sp.]